MPLLQPRFELEQHPNKGDDLLVGGRGTTELVGESGDRLAPLCVVPTGPAIQLGGVAIGTLGFSCFPAAIAIIEAVVFKDRISKLELALIGLITLGLILVTPSFDFANQAMNLFLKQFQPPTNLLYCYNRVDGNNGCQKNHD